MTRTRLSRQATPRRVVGYVRVSTEDQAREGVSLGAQEDRIRAFAFATGRELDEIVVDAGESAKTLKRPGLTRVLADLRAGLIEAVVVLKLDRLTRSVRDLADLLDAFQRRDAALVSVSESLDTSTASGRLMLNLLASVSQWEREAIGERTADALAHKRRSGAAYGTTPFGYQRDGDAFIPVTSEQAALRDAIRLNRCGASLREIARHLTGLGVMPHKGKAWHASSVRAVLRSRIATEVA